MSDRIDIRAYQIGLVVNSRWCRTSKNTNEIMHDDEIRKEEAWSKWMDIRGRWIVV